MTPLALWSITLALIHTTHLMVVIASEAKKRARIHLRRSNSTGNKFVTLNTN